MLEAIMLAIFGVPIVYVGMGLWMCCTIALLDAVRTYTEGESRPLGRMLKRMGRDE